MDQENAYDPTCLRRLDNDVLLQIIQAHLPRDDLRSLSLTSTWMRQLCMPTLFSKCSINSQALSSGPENFISESIRSYVRCVLPPYARPFSSHPQSGRTISSILQLNGLFDRRPIRASSWAWEHVPAQSIHYEPDERAGDFLTGALDHMPAVHSVIINNLQVHAFSGSGNAAVPLSVILSILSSPHIRHFTVLGYLYHPCDPIPKTISMLAAPLVSFEYISLDLRWQPRSYPSEAALLKILLPKFRHTLEKLVLPVENAPLRRFLKKDWPRLRELQLSGEWGADRNSLGNLPLVSILARMPELRSLRLMFHHPPNVNRQTKWPCSAAIAFPWPNLEHLYLSHPDPDDALWCHLPASLHTLALQCYPRAGRFQQLKRDHYMLHNASVHWHTPLLSASEMLRLLRSCQTRSLTHLLIEYRADMAEDALLEYVALTWPALEVLEVRRYRPEEGRELSLVGCIHDECLLHALTGPLLYRAQSPASCPHSMHYGFSAFISTGQK